MTCKLSVNTITTNSYNCPIFFKAFFIFYFFIILFYFFFKKHTEKMQMLCNTIWTVDILTHTHTHTHTSSMVSLLTQVVHNEFTTSLE